MNISGVELTENKGLKFALKKNLNRFNTYIDINKFARSLHIKKYMMSKPGENLLRNSSVKSEIKFSDLKNKSLFNPPMGTEGHIEVFRRMVLKDL